MKSHGFEILSSATLLAGLLASYGMATQSAYGAQAVVDAQGDKAYQVDSEGRRLPPSQRRHPVSMQKIASAPELAPVGATSVGAPASGAVSDPAAFDPYEAYPTGSWPEAAAVGDVNGDGRNDVVMTTSQYVDPDNDYKLFVFLQDQYGSLEPARKYSIQRSEGGSPDSVDVGDVNNDGLMDVVIGNSKSSVEVFLQDATGALQFSAEYPTIHSTVIKIADLNGDGLQDVAGIGWGTTDVAVFLQNQSGQLDLPTVYTALHGGYDDLDIGDVNGDGLNDIVVMSGQLYAYDNLAVLLADGAGGFNEAVYYDLGGNELTSGVAVGDVDGDGDDDVVVSYGGNRPSSKMGIFYQSAGTLNPVASTLDSHDIPEPVEIADMNGDGRDDIVTLHGGWSRMGVYLQQADGSLQEEELHVIPYASHYGPQGLDLGDIDNNQSPDALIADYNHGLVVLRNRSTAKPTPAFFDDMEEGLDNWTIEGTDGMGGAALWHESAHRFRSAATALYYGQEGTLDYDTGRRNYGSATSVPIDLSGLSGVELSFYHYLRTENFAPYDTARVQVSADGGETWDDVFVTARETEGADFEQVVVSLSAYDGQTIQLRYSFDTLDAWYNQYEGWVVDDVEVAGQLP